MKKLLLLTIIIFSFCIANAQWQQVPLYGGSINSLAICGNYMFAGTYDSGVFLTLDSGANWAPVNNGIPNDSRIYSLAVSDTIIYAGGQNVNGDAIVFKTINYGMSWSTDTLLPCAIGGYAVNSIVASGTDIFATIQYGGVFLSSDGGNNWNPVNNGLTTLSVFTIAKNGNDIYVGTFYNGIFKSTDNGANWVSANIGLPAGCNVGSIVFSGTNIFADVYDYYLGGVYKSTDNGLSWVSASNGLNPSVNVLAVCGSKIFASTSTGVYQTINNGQNWSTINAGLTNRSINAFAVNGLDIFAGSSGNGVFLFANGSSGWVNLTKGITDVSINSFMLKGNNFFAGSSQGGVYLTTDNGNNWSSVNTGLSNLGILSFCVNGNTIFAGTYGGIYKSTNNGTSWSNSNTGMPAGHGAKSIVMCGTDIFACIYNGIYKSTNNGSSWITTSLINQDLTSMTVSDSSIYVSSCDNGVFKTIDNGNTWTNTGLSTYNFKSLAVVGADIFVGADWGKYFLSTNNGISWDIAVSGYHCFNYVQFYTFFVSGNYLFVGTDCGIFYTKNNGVDWFDANDGLTSLNINSIGLDGLYLYAGISGKGVWKRLLSEITGVAGISEINDNNSLVYPNPSNGKFTLTNVTDINSIEVVNMLGGIIYKTANNNQNNIEVDISNFVKGIYFVKLYNGKGYRTEKIVVQ